MVCNNTNLIEQEVINVDLCEAILKQLPQVEPPLMHSFTPGLYTRQIFMKAGLLIVSKIHNTEHPFFILQGDVTVYTEGADTIRLTAPYFGITQPGTRRVLFTNEDTIWATCHVNPDNGEDLIKIEERIMIKHDSVPLENFVTQVIKNYEYKEATV